MSDKQEPADELAGSEQPFVQHLMELRDRLLYCLYGVAIAMALLAVWPGPSGLIDLIAVPIRAHMPPDVKLIAVGVFTPFFIPLKVLMMSGLLLALALGAVPDLGLRRPRSLQPREHFLRCR